jgi:hypothetical protein
LIRTFTHRGLKRLYERDDRSGIRPDILDIVEDILARLDERICRKRLTFPVIGCTRSKAS